MVYTYDNGGNIKSKNIYAYTTATDPGTPTQTISYTYDSTWKDKLTNYNGTAITYDEIGNPLTYRDGMSFTWNGRQMATANLNGTAVTYKYDADGLRNYKKVGSTVHEYEYVGGQLVYEKRGDLKFYYRYNAMGELASIKRVNAAGSEYTVYVVTNTRGDVEELRLADGSLYARYVYDSWGNVLHVYDGTGAEVTSDKTNYLSIQNPFRYRGYYYDSESRFYYIDCRYYDPQVGRFINADSIDVLTVSKMSLMDKNIFAYCDNNPITRTDSDGNCWHIVAGVVVGAVTSAFSTLITDGIEGEFSPTNIVFSAMIGAVAGGMMAALPQLSVVVSAVSSAAESIITDVRNGSDFKTTATNAAVSAGFGALTGAGGSDFSGKSGKIIDKAVDSFSKIGKGNHPIVKGNAKKSINTAKKYVAKTYATGQIFDTAISLIKTGVQKVTNWFVNALFGG